MNAPTVYTQCLLNRYHNATDAHLQLTKVLIYRPVRGKQLLHEVQTNVVRATRRQQIQKLGLTVTAEPAA
jgi:hypothetical protein